MVKEKLWGEEVPDAARFAEQARFGRDEEERSRAAELVTPHVLANEVTIRKEIISNDFGGAWNDLADSNSIFVVAEFFSKRFEFLVCSHFNHMQRDCTCACAVACLHSLNSISNVVASVTIHDNIYMYFLKEM